MRKLSLDEISNLSPEDLIYFMDKYDQKKYKAKIRNITAIRGGANGDHIQFDYIREIGKFGIMYKSETRFLCYDNGLNFEYGLYGRHSNHTDFYVPDNHKIINQCLRRSYCEILNKYTKTDIGTHLLAENDWF